MTVTDHCSMGGHLAANKVQIKQLISGTGGMMDWKGCCLQYFLKEGHIGWLWKANPLNDMLGKFLDQRSLPSLKFGDKK